MDGLDAVFYLLVLGFILTIGYLYTRHLLPSKDEGFISSSASGSASASSASASSASASSAAKPVSDVELKIRAALDPYLNDDLCTIYKEIRSVLAQAIQGDSLTPTADTLAKVEKSLTKEITLPPLPCPPFTYPTAHSEVEWINFLNGIPTNIGGVFVLMAIYAQRELAYRVKNLKLALDGSDIISEDDKNTVEKLRILGKIVLSSMPTEGFNSIIGLCPMTVQAARASSPCAMPQDLTHEEIIQSMDNILAKMAAEKNSILSALYISPTIDVKPFIADALKNVVYLKSLISKASDGTLIDHLVNSASGSVSPMSV
jgi:hypothetical protein